MLGVCVCVWRLWSLQIKTQIKKHVWNLWIMCGSNSLALWPGLIFLVNKWKKKKKAWNGNATQTWMQSAASSSASLHHESDCFAESRFTVSRWDYSTVSKSNILTASVSFTASKSDSFTLTTSESFSCIVSKSDSVVHCNSILVRECIVSGSNSFTGTVR